MIRNSLFSIFFFVGIIIISIIFLPALLLPRKITLVGGKLMGHWAGFCLRIFLSVKIIIKGKENIITDQKFFIAASHQSMFETFYLQTVFNSPVFILKKELLRIPIFGWYLKKIGSISINRNKISRDNLGFFEDILRTVNSSNRPLIIFPQGTRVLPEERPSFKKGASRIYQELNIACQPVAVNSGYVWPKKGKKNSNKTITISILTPVSAGMDKEIFLKILDDEISNNMPLEIIEKAKNDFNERLERAFLFLNVGNFKRGKNDFNFAISFDAFRSMIAKLPSIFSLVRFIFKLPSISIKSILRFKSERFTINSSSKLTCFPKFALPLTSN